MSDTEPEQIAEANGLSENGGTKSDLSPEEEQLEVASDERLGTISSARFNILSTMVGGGALSLPMAFQKTGNGLLGPLFLIATAIITGFCFRVLLTSARTLSPVSPTSTSPGKDSFESVASAAFGPKANIFSMGLVVSMCFAGIIGYAVLLRDMLQPIADAVQGHDSPSGPTFANNLTMLTVVFLATPLCTLKTLTALKQFGALSMLSILILGFCILFRSLQCNLGGSHHNAESHPSFQLWPDSWKDVLDATPLFISCYVCHYNLLTVHNELRRPSQERVSWWLRSTTWGASIFYMMIGLSGSAYGHCTPTGKVQGNVLLDFNEDDPLLLIGRMCLALTITLAFPMLTIPARDILIRSLPEFGLHADRTETTGADSSAIIDGGPTDNQESLREPLLENGLDEHHAAENGEALVSDSSLPEPETPPSPSLLLRLVTSILVFWTAAAIASCVSSIDVVWDLLGSSLSIILSYLIPCGSYIVISKNAVDEETGERRLSRLSIAVAWFLIIVSFPLMIVSTANAVYDTFF